MEPQIIPEVILEIGDNLYLKITDVEYTRGKPAYISGLPEDCHDGEGSEINWKDENVKLVTRRSEHIRVISVLKKVETRVNYIDVEFTVEPALAVEYYDALLDHIYGIYNISNCIYVISNNDWWNK